MVRQEAVRVEAPAAVPSISDTLSAFPVHLPFVMTAPAYEPPYPGAEFEQPRAVPQPLHMPANPQTQALLTLLGLQLNFAGASGGGPGTTEAGRPVPRQPVAAADNFEIPLTETPVLPSVPAVAPPPDPAEIDLGDIY